MSNIEKLLLKVLDEAKKHISLHEVMEQYLYRCSLKVRDQTYIYYSRLLQEVIEYLSTIGINNTRDLDRYALLRYIDYCKQERKNSNNTINKHLGAFKQALTYCKKEGLISENIMDEFEMLKKVDQETKIIQTDHLRAIIQYVDNQEQTFYDDRVQLMIYILIDTGIRLNELRHIETSNIDLVNGSIRLLFTKTSKHRTVYLSKRTSSLIANFITRYSVEGYLMVDEYNRNQLAPQNLYKCLKKIKMKLKLPPSVSISFHKFRHTYATQCLINGANILFVKETLGHTELTQTQKYLHLSDSLQKQQHTQFTPVNNL